MSLSLVGALLQAYLLVAGLLVTQTHLLSDL
jgi:hypothetical protein